MRQIVAIFLALSLATGLVLARTRRDGTYTATAYSTRGQTASGEAAHRQVAAADPDLLPLGSRIRIRGAGAYSGEYIVADTGRRVRGRKLDLYIPNRRAARRFGKRTVHVQVIGNNY